MNSYDISQPSNVWSLENNVVLDNVAYTVESVTVLLISFEGRHEKTGLLGIRPDLT